MEAQLEPLQSDATSGVGKTLTVPEPERIVRFLIRSHITPCQSLGFLGPNPPKNAEHVIRKQLQVILDGRCEERRYLRICQNFLTHPEPLHFDSLYRIFLTPAATNAEIKHGAQVTQKCVANARGHSF